MKYYKKSAPSRIKYPLIAFAITLMASTSAKADEQIDELKRELAQQRELIQQLLQAQQEMKDAKPYTPPKVSLDPPVLNVDKVVTFYGLADVGVQNTDSGMGHKWTVGTGGWLASRFGVSVNKPISPDLSAVAVAEAGVQYGTGSAGAGSVTPGINNGYPSSSGATADGSQLFGRQIYAGLNSKTWGGLTIGRQYAASFALHGMGNALAYNGYGYSGSLIGADGMPSRVNNSILYTSPVINGFTGHVMYSAGSENNTSGDVQVKPGSPLMTNDKSGRGVDVSLFYQNNAFLLGASAWDFYQTAFTTGESGLAKRRGAQLVGTYDFGPVKLYGNYVHGQIKGNNYENITKAFSKTDGYNLSAMLPLGKHRFYMSFTNFDDKSSLNKDAKLYGLAYTYQAQETIKYYVALGRMANGKNSSFSLPDGGNLVGTVNGVGTAVNGVMAGVAMGF